MSILLASYILTEARNVNKRQVQDQDNFFLFGQVAASLFNLFNTALKEGQKFVSRQMEVNEPVVETVGNISTAIAASEFGTTLQRSVQGAGSGVVRGTQCALCSIQPNRRNSETCRTACRDNP